MITLTDFLNVSIFNLYFLGLVFCGVGLIYVYWNFKTWIVATFLLGYIIFAFLWFWLPPLTIENLK